MIGISNWKKNKDERTTMYKNNSGLIAKTKVCKYKKGLCLTEKLVRENPLLFLYETVRLSQNSSLYHLNLLCQPDDIS
ncbi:hypothetical protein GCM10011414_29820 [Croceivirga lutea]|nr:hypothetical protein GCM10011414_29820 [Croceivirga lutea]